MYLNICHDLFEGISPNIPPDHERNVGTRCSDYERAATRTIRSEHSSWHDPAWIKTQILQLTSCPAAISAQYLQNFIKSSDRVNVQKIRWIPNIRRTVPLLSAWLDIWYASKAITAARKYRRPAYRYSKSHEGGDFVWFLYLIRICVWPLGGTWIRYQQLFIPDRPRAEGRGIHNINNIRCRRSSQPRTMINIAFCFQAWGFQFLYKPRNLRTENAKSLSHTHRFLLEAIILG